MRAPSGLPLSPALAQPCSSVQRTAQDREPHLLLHVQVAHDLLLGISNTAQSFQNKCGRSCADAPDGCVRVCSVKAGLGRAQLNLAR